MGWDSFDATGKRQVVVAGGGTGSVNPLDTTGRLTLTSGNAAPNVDPGARSTLYYTSCANDGTVTAAHFSIVLYNGSSLVAVDSAEISLSLTLTSGKVYDVFVDYNGGTPQLVLSAAWTNTTTRADALAAQSGIVVKSGTAAYRWVGTIYATGTNQTTDALDTRTVWNAYNQLPRYAYIQDTNSHTYSGAERNYDNSGTTTLIQFVQGQAAPITWAFGAYIYDTNSETANATVISKIDGGTTEPNIVQLFAVSGPGESETGGWTFTRATAQGYHSGLLRETGSNGTVTFSFAANSALIDN